MRLLRYNVAMSLDGFIARHDGSFDWIVQDPAVDFEVLINEFDTLLMGRKTYEVIKRQNTDEHFKNLNKIVVSTTLLADRNQNIAILNRDIIETVQELKTSIGKDIWLFGGSVLFGYLADARLVDTIEVALMPVVLGDGIPLISTGSRSFDLVLTGHKKLKSGIIFLKYNIDYSKKKK